MKSVTDDCVLLFVKYPEAGRVKTRMAEDLGEQKACEIYRIFVEDLLGMLDELDRQFEIHFDPPDAQKLICHWLGTERTYVPQSSADLGRRMADAFIHAFANGRTRVVIIGSDSPDLPPDSIAAAFSALDTNDAVIGPSSDGGYYLIGFSKDGFLEAAFENIRWSSEDVLRQTIDTLNHHGRSCHLLRQWHDVDTVEDVKALLSRCSGTALEHSQTISFLKSLDIQ